MAWWFRFAVRNGSTWNWTTTPVVYRRRTRGTRSETPRRHALVFPDALHGVFTHADSLRQIPTVRRVHHSGNEDAAITVGNSVYYRSTYGYSPSGGLYQGTERGLLRVEALVPKPSTLALALGGIAWSAWGGRTQ